LSLPAFCGVIRAYNEQSSKKWRFEMALINWTDNLSVGVKVSDDQHKKLIDLINKLNDAMRVGRSKEVISEIIAGLANYTVTHFATEEKYFDQFGYPGAASHKREHNDFVKKVSDFKEGFDKGNLMLSIDITKFLRDWLVKHIQGTDKKYTSFFNEHGLK